MRKPKAKPALTDADKALAFLESLKVPEGRSSGKPLRVAPFQASFVHGLLAPENQIGVLSVGRGNGKSALTAGLALGCLTGAWDTQPRRTIFAVARTRDQARIVHDYTCGLALSLPSKMRANIQIRRGSRLEVEYSDASGPHLLRVLPADAKSSLGLSPVFALMDERAAWNPDEGDAVEASLLTALGKRGGRAAIVSTSAASDVHPFSKWVDNETAGVYRQEHRAASGLPADDLPSLLEANPGTQFGIGSTEEWLVASARRAIQRGGSALSSFRNFIRNERVSSETRDVLVTVDQWQACEVEQLPPREGEVLIGIDLGGSASMSAAAYYWPATGRLETLGWFPSTPSLLERGQQDGVGARYEEMRSRGELSVLPGRVVPLAPLMTEILRHIEGQPIGALVTDRYRQAEAQEAYAKAGMTAPVVFRGMGYRDGSEDCERFRRSVFDREVKTRPTLLMRSALADAVCMKDPAANVKLAKARSTGRIDPVVAAVLAVAEGARRRARSAAKAGRLIWT
jgi:phage terminase large subunit-like protein